ncbi:hypothetical protein [Streptomyces canus]|uniref:hypothetical protein n=1 Tax=Streptomyces canus TaxID=58343 RepID=UPI003827AAB7
MNSSLSAAFTASSAASSSAIQLTRVRPAEARTGRLDQPNPVFLFPPVSDRVNVSR